MASASMVVVPDGTTPVGLSDDEELRRSGRDFNMENLLEAVGLNGEQFDDSTIGTDN